jgi:uncharacterized DUF497 family protein/uncharacterized protein (DUF4415 family)
MGARRKRLRQVVDFGRYINVTIVEWDERKATSNLAKHHVSFELAATAFDDPFAMIFADREDSDDEHREKLLGLSDKGVLVVVFVSRFRRERIFGESSVLAKPTEGNRCSMRKTDEEFLMEDFDVAKARRFTPRELEENRKAIEAKLGVKRAKRGRPKKPPHEKYVLTRIRIDPRVLAWAKREAKKQHIGYQTVLNQHLVRTVVK